MVETGTVVLEKIFKSCQCIFKDTTLLKYNLPLEKDMVLHLKRLEFPLLQDGSGEDKNVKSLQMDRHADRDR